jgi:hypothetical protein
VSRREDDLGGEQANDKLEVAVAVVSPVAHRTSEYSAGSCSFIHTFVLFV